MGLTGDSGVVDQHRYRPQLPFCFTDHGGYSLPVGHVRLDGDGVTALIVQRLDHLLGGLGAVEVVDAYSAARLSQLQSDGPANAPGGACYQCNLSHKSSSLLRFAHTGGTGRSPRPRRLIG